MWRLVSLCLLALSVLALMGVVVVDAYGTGPPLSACVRMVPTGHGASTVSGSNPFTIDVDNSSYVEGQEIEVTISGANFIGFFVQARRRDSSRDNDEAIGTIGSIDTSRTKLLNCGSGTANAWSHKSNVPKSSVTATWTAPSSDEGPIAFRATVVQGPTSDKYWTEIYSSDIYYGTDGPPANSVTTQMTTGDAGRTLGCSLYLLLATIIAAFIASAV